MGEEGTQLKMAASDIAPAVARKRKSPEETERTAAIKRGPPVDYHKIHDKKLKGRMAHSEALYRESQKAAVKVNEWLLPSGGGSLEAEGMERTWRFKQEELVQQVDVGAASKAFDLQLPDLGPYRVDFTRSGRYMLIGGEKGHIAMMDWQRSQLICELQVAETTRDVIFLHNEMFFAAAQKKYAYIYDKRGIEVHCLRDHGEVSALEFLPHHFLLASIGESGVLRYQDTSHGAMAAVHRTRLGPCSVLRQNPRNAVLCLGHSRGVVSMWTPNMSSPVVKMLCHRGPVLALANDQTGHHMVTSGADGQVKVWDLRTFKPLHEYYSHSPATHLDISQRGLLAVGYGRKVQVWRDALREKQASPYMSHTLDSGGLHGMRFVPYDDVLGVGHAGGVSSMLVPGAGEANYDSYVANPFQSRKERREQEVAHLLDKLQPESIVLDPDTIGRVIQEPQDVLRERRALMVEAERVARKEAAVKADSKSKMKGKNRPSKRHRKKQVNIVEEKKGAMLQRIDVEKAELKKAKAAEERAEVLATVPRALQRFYKS